MSVRVFGAKNIIFMGQSQLAQYRQIARFCWQNKKFFAFLMAGHYDAILMRQSRELKDLKKAESMIIPESIPQELLAYVLFSYSFTISPHYIA